MYLSARDSKAKHLLVMRKGNMYVFDIVDRDGNLLKPAEIQSHLKYILSDPTPAAAFPLGVLTSENRDVWAGLRDKLIAAGNAEDLQSVDGALFCLSLDDESMRDNIHISHNMLHGDGCNRWFDKSFTVILTKDGQAAINFEHFMGHNRAAAGEPGLCCCCCGFSLCCAQTKVQPGQRAVRTASEKPKKTLTQLYRHLTIDAMQFTKGGKAQLKKSKISPDAVAQLAFQMGFLRQYGQTVATYDSPKKQLWVCIIQ
uniref:Choline/carnitine acyltransferase domain-containing protein n=1 Tax=Cyclopterus lumpus TaxID=8103 RepID=A0A8C2XN04_CYCLU